MPGDIEQSRRALGMRLREVRLDAGLSARELARLAGWHFSKVSKLEHGTRPPSQQDIRAWCIHCGAPEQAPDLIATARAVDAMYVEWRRKMRSGLKHFQDSYQPLYEQTSLFRVYQTMFLPDLLATAGYTAAVLRAWAGLMSLPADTDAAVAARMQRQNLLHGGNRRFEIILEEQVLRTRAADADVMAGQLDRLLAIATMPAVSLGIIPAGGRRTVMMQSCFWIFDDSQAQVETPSALLSITQPAEIAIYAQLFEQLQRSALHGRGARQLIGRAARDLASE
ncbi:MAG: helix-turn-helix transcriptional regulator [Streptosporangiaceae bacterium]